MKKITVVLFLLLLILSCKSKKEVSRHSVYENKHEQMAIESDSNEVTTKTTTNTEAKKEEQTNSYSKQTDYDSVGRVTTIKEIYTNINLQVDFKNKIDEISKGSFKYNTSTITTDTTSTVINEASKEESGSNPLHGGWGFVLGIAIIAVVAFGNFLKNYFARII